jgi:hypothetical protein
VVERAKLLTGPKAIGSLAAAAAVSVAVAAAVVWALASLPRTTY